MLFNSGPELLYTPK